MKMIHQQIILILLIAVGTSATFQMEDTSCPNSTWCHCNKQMTSVDCSDHYKELTFIPDIPVTVLHLDLSFNWIRTVAPGDFDKLTSIQTLDLSFNRINTVAPGTFDKLTSIQTLDLRGNGINTVAPGTFDKLTSIQTLDLSFNRINTVAPGTFDKLTSIQTLDLSFNRINTVAPGTFDKLTSIQTLDLSYNWINTVAPGTFDKLTSIQTLDLSYNWINTVAPGTFDKLTSIQTLDLSHNRINTVAPGTFDKLTSIQTLDLSHNRINTVAPGTFDKLTSIQTLDLSHNRINTVAPGTFDKLTSIQTLDLSRNRIKTVAPGNFDKLTSIQTLDLHKNSPLTISGLTNIADGLRRKHLTRLDLSGVFSTPEQLKTGLSVLMNIRTLNLGLCSKFSSITSEIAFEEFRHIIIIRLTKDELFHFSELKFHGIKNLLWIDLAENKFTSFPKDLPNSLEFLNLRGNHITSDLIAQVSSAPLVSLRVLDLSDNDLEYVHHDGIFRSLKSLQVLRLEKNKLGKTVFSSKISELLFSGLTELEEINISSNNIRNLSKSVFRDQVSLKVLKINDNQLSRWDLNSFKFTKNLEKLDLSYNIITGVTEKNLHDLNYLQELNLTGNRFVCNCDLLWFREWIDNTSVVLPGKESYMCHGPDEWRGKLFLEFTKDTSNCTYTIAGSVSDNDSVSVAVIGSVCAALLISLLTVTFVYRNRWRIRLRLYLIAKLGRLFLRVMGHGQMTHDRGINEDNDQGLYDAYISCSENDHEWVLQHLLPDIDNGRLDDDNIFGGDFKFYYDPRDKDPGVSIIANIYEHMSRSRKLIVVLTQHLFNDGMNEFELDQATIKYHDNELEDIIVVKVGDVPARRIPVHLHTQMRTGRFLEWEDDVNAIETFKAKLKDRLCGTGENVDIC